MTKERDKSFVILLIYYASKSISTKNSKNSDTSYQPSTNDNSTSPFLNKNNTDSRYLTNSIKYIQPILKTFNNNNSTSETNKSQKIQNRKLRKKIIPTNSYEYQHQKTTSPSINQYSTN